MKKSNKSQTPWWMSEDTIVSSGEIKNIINGELGSLMSDENKRNLKKLMNMDSVFEDSINKTKIMNNFSKLYDEYSKKVVKNMKNEQSEQNKGQCICPTRNINKECIKTLMDEHYLSGKTFGFGNYTGQLRSLRRIAISKFGTEKVALLSDSELEKLFHDEGYVPVCVSLSNACDYETLYLVPIEVLDKCERLER